MEYIGLLPLTFVSNIMNIVLYIFSSCIWIFVFINHNFHFHNIEEQFELQPTSLHIVSQLVAILDNIILACLVDPPVLQGHLVHVFCCSSNHGSCSWWYSQRLQQRWKKCFSFCHPDQLVQYFLPNSTNFKWVLCKYIWRNLMN